MHKLTPVRPTDACFYPAVRRSGHIERAAGEMMGRWNLLLRSVGSPCRDDFRLCLSLSEFDSVHKHGSRCSGAMAISVHQHATCLRNSPLRTWKDPSGSGVSVWWREATGEQARELTLGPDVQSCVVQRAPNGSRRDRGLIACARRRWFRSGAAFPHRARIEKQSG